MKTTATRKPGRSPAQRSERLRASPNFVLAFTLDGRPYVAKETEPYIQYWLTERYRILLSLFSCRGGSTVDDAIDDYLRLTRTPRSAAAMKRLRTAIDDMRDSAVLVTTGADTSRYDEKIVDAYVEQRPFPRELSDLIIRQSPVTAESRVLDLAGGPGDLALALATASNHVSLMELSRGFLNAATIRAKRRGVPLTTLHESCNRLVYSDDEYDVITVSQALHWLDDVLVCRGVCRALKPDGSFYVIHGATDIPDDHPLAFVLGDKSILGHKPPGSYRDQIAPLLRRLTLLFAALDAPDVQRIDIMQRWDASAAPIVPAGVSLFRQERPFDAGYARGFLTPQHIATSGMTPAQFWNEVDTRCAGASADRMLGHQDWAVLHFRRGGTAIAPDALETCKPVSIGFERSEL